MTVYLYFKILIILAVLPGLFLAYKVYQLDKIEREPIGLIVALSHLNPLFMPL